MEDGRLARPQVELRSTDSPSAAFRAGGCPHVVLAEYRVVLALVKSAAKRRKNAAHGASRGCKWKMIELRRSER